MGSWQNAIGRQHHVEHANGVVARAYSIRTILRIKVMNVPDYQSGCDLPTFLTLAGNLLT